MIGELHGCLLRAQVDGLLVLEVAGGVGVELRVPSGLSERLPPLGEELRLHTHLVVRADEWQLYGFGERAERDLFRILIRVAGVGPGLALAALSGMTVAELVRCVRDSDVVRLASVRGIGKRTAERLVVEVRDKLALWAVSPLASSAANDQAVRDAEQALVALGYGVREAARMVSEARRTVDAASGEALIREALRRQSAI